MFYAGVYRDEKSGSADIVIIEKVLRSAKKQYFIRDMRTLPAGTPFEGVVGELASVYADRAYVKKKKVFSQNGRPPKEKREKPVLVVHFSEGEALRAETIRAARIPVEAVITGDEKNGTGKSGYYGTNHHAGREEIAEKLALVIDTDRIVFGPDGYGLAEQVLQADGPFSDGVDGCVTALALAVWHCEAIRSVKRY